MIFCCVSGVSGKPAIGRVDDQRRSEIRGDFAAIPPDRIVGARVARCEEVHPPAASASRAAASSRRKELSAGDRRGPFERRQRGIRPGALQVWVAPRGTRRCLRLRCALGVRRRRRGLARVGRHRPWRPHDERREHSDFGRKSVSHEKPPASSGIHHYWRILRSFAPGPTRILSNWTGWRLPADGTRTTRVVWVKE